ncbi:hypothetical protein ACFE04_031614 [Oxalis oulophora]
MEKAGLGLEITELRLGLPGAGGEKNPNPNYVKKRAFSEIDNDEKSNTTGSDSNSSSCSNITTGGGVETKTSGGPPAKNQVVGWPPVCSYRKKNSFNEASKKYVKVSMDGAPFLRKIDLGLHKDYSDLAMALEKLFGCVGINEALMDAESSEYAPIYEDRDGDWMLAGDVPWEMFIESCKRLRIMKRSEAKGFGFMQTRVGNGGDLTKDE